MSKPSQKARECKTLYDTTELDVDEAFDRVTLELREALREAIQFAESEGYVGGKMAGWRAILESYTPTPEEEKG